MDESYQQRQRSCDLLQSLTDKQMGKKHKVAAGKESRELTTNTTSNSLSKDHSAVFSLINYKSCILHSPARLQTIHQFSDFFLTGSHRNDFIFISMKITDICSFLISVSGSVQQLHI